MAKFILKGEFTTNVNLNKKRELENELKYEQIKYISYQVPLTNTSSSCRIKTKFFTSLLKETE